MDLKARLKHGLEHARGFTDTVLGEIAHDKDWVRRPHPQANHALWIAGHLGLATDYFLGLVDADKKQDREEWKTLFGKGTQPLEDLNAYPAPDAVTGCLEERSSTFLAMLDQCTEDDFDRPVTNGPPFVRDVGEVFQMAAWHETLHSGQLTVIHRMLGNTPIADR